MNISDDFRLIGGSRYSYDQKNSSISSVKINVAGNTVSGPFIFMLGKKTRR